jgi:hypothetical protein
MKPRSPVLGYNHNVRYANRLWHVQTEDSGVQNPHIFTHLFHNGTILATKRLDYDPAAEVSAVQKLMQAQHKAMLRELKAGAYDEKIAKYFGEPVVRDASADESGEISGPVMAAAPAAPAPAAAPPAPPLDDDGTVFDPYVPTAMREERAARGERVTSDHVAAAPSSAAAGPTATPVVSDTAIEPMGSAPTLLAVTGASTGEEGARFRDTLSTPPPVSTTNRPPATPPTAPRVPTPAGGVRARVPTPVGSAAPQGPTPPANAKPSSALPPARAGSSPPDATPPALTPRPPPLPGGRPSPPSGATPVRPPSQPQPPVAPPARPSTQPQLARPPSQPSVSAPTTQPQISRPSQPSSSRPPSQPGAPRPPSQPQLARPPVAGTTRPAPGRPAVGTPPRPGVPPSTVPATGVRPGQPAQGGGIGERRRSPSQPSFSKPTAEGVVVARPAVIIGGESSRAPAARTTSTTSQARWSGDPPPLDPGARPSSDNIFGGDLISEKSLDEVILAYLSEDLNEK